jgi:hypothetical protein
MSSIRNVLISFGAFWASLWVAGLLQWPLDKIVDINAIVRDENVFSGILMGVMSSMSRTLAAVLAGILVTMVVASRKPRLWALVVAVLYVVDAPVRHHWGYPATTWDRLWQSVDLVFPAVACILAGVITARLRGQRSDTEQMAQPSTAG